MHFDVRLQGEDIVVITSHPFGDDDRIHSRWPCRRDSNITEFGMTIAEIADLVGFVTDDEGNVIEKTPRGKSVSPYQGELPDWIRKR